MKQRSVFRNDSPFKDPFGGIEGMILLHLLQRIRPDVKIMANYMLGRMPEMAEYSIFVDPFGTKQSTRRNLTGMKDAIRWVKEGHMLAVFPAGEVSHIDLQKRATAGVQYRSEFQRCAGWTGLG